MTNGLPEGSSTQHEDRDGDTAAETIREGTVPVLAVVSAPWAGPSRPAPTVLRELGRRWGSAAQVMLVEEPDEKLLESWSISVLPTWLRFDPLSGAAGEEDDVILPEIVGTDVDGSHLRLRGPWRIGHRLTGAQPKHVIDAEFGPGA